MLHGRTLAPRPFRKRESGMTLLEISVGITLISMIVLILGRLLLTTQGLMVDVTQRDELVERSRRIIDDLELELMIARVHSIEVTPAGVPTIVYALPVDIGEDANGNGFLDADEDQNGNLQLDTTDGDALSPTGQVQWGCQEGSRLRLDHPADPHRISLSFVRGDLVSEASLGADLNRDGDMNDNFRRGSLQRTTTGGDTRQHGGTMLLLGDDPSDADRDGDGVADPLFSVSGERFVDSDGNGVRSPGESFVDTNGNGRWDGFWRLHLTFYLLDSQRTPHVLQLVREIAPRNPQE